VKAILTIHPLSFLSQCRRGYFHEIQAYAMWDVTNCDMVCDILLETMLIITPKPGYGMVMTPTTY
jgi:hypothetical protein